MDQKTPVPASANDPSVEKEKVDAEDRREEVLKTPARPVKAAKRKHPDTMTTPSRPEEGGSVKKRRRSSSGVAMTRVGSPGTSLLKPAMTERQQMALLLQMTNPSKQQSPVSAASVVGSPATPETTPRRLQRKNERGETPLHLAAIKGDHKAVSSLLRQGADVKVTDHAGWTPLHEACNYGHSEVARELLSHNADVGALGMDGDTPMHDAVINGHLETVRVLLQHGGNPHHTNDKGLSPIDICTHMDILDLLKSHDQGHTPTEDTERDGANPSEENPYPKQSHSSTSNQDDHDITDKEEDYSPVFSPEPAAETTPTHALTTPTSGSPSIAKKTRLREVSFSDISSSESDPEVIGGRKKSVEVTVGEEVKVGVASPILATKKETDSKDGEGTINEDHDVEFPSNDINSPELNQETTSPSREQFDSDQQHQNEDDEGSSTEEGGPQITAPGHESRVDVSEEMLLSIPLSVVKVSPSGTASAEDTSHGDAKGTSPPDHTSRRSSVESVRSEDVGRETKPSRKSGGAERTTQGYGPESESFSISLDFNNIKSPPSRDTTPSLHVTHGPIRTQSQDSPDYIRTQSEPPYPLPPSTTEQNDTVISFRTSLPLVFSCHSTPSTSVSRLSPSPSESMKVSPGQPAPTPERKRSGSQDSIPLPPKMRYRPVVRSAVIQQRIDHPPQEPSDSTPSSLISDYRSREPVTPVNPKVVYPPLPLSLYKQFSEQEAERARLATAHSVEQDRLRLSLIQELTRAQQRATKGHTPISACAVLLERLLPPATPTHHSTPGLKVETEYSHSSPTVRPLRECEDGLDSRLLSGLVQDVWDKFQDLKFTLISRQRHEAQALWLTQRDQWCYTKRDNDNLSAADIPQSHVPLVSFTNLNSPLYH